jgi:alpha-D-ribose 1-methylphosphonate 5-triphosphate diphosphatase
VDIHGDMLERELEPRPNTQFPISIALAELDKRLCSNGITTAYAAVALADGPGLRSESRAEGLIHAIHQTRKELRCQILVHVRFEVSVPSGVPLLERLLQENLVQMVSLMDHTPGQGQFRNLEYYVEYMTKWLGGNREAAQATANAHLETPISWEIAKGIAGLALERQIPLASHDDDTPEKVALMQQLGTSIAEFPVTLEAAHAAAEAGMRVIMGAPNALRGGSHSGNLSALEGIAAGVVHGLCADYHPASLLHAALRITTDDMPLHKAVNLVSLEPARAAGLVGRGAIQTGFKADLTVLRGSRVAATWREGKLIYADSSFPNPHGS